ETMARSAGETLTQEGSETQNTLTPATDGGDNPKTDDITDVGNIVDDVLKSLNEQDPESDAGKNVETSETQE
ncbi:hypothetical protein A2U01_0109699, partial [Trifolium medium]|nr:hypothetical protein [Trifolium medium]